MAYAAARTPCENHYYYDKKLILPLIITSLVFIYKGWSSFDSAMIVAQTCISKADTATLAIQQRGQLLEIKSRSSNLKLSALWLAKQGATQAVVMTHGMDECLDDPRFIAAANLFQEAGFSVLLVEMSNHGKSEKTDGFHGFGTKAAKDLLGGWDWLKSKGYDDKKIVIYGQSLGGSAALFAAQLEPLVATIIADSPMTRIDWALIDGGSPAWFVPIFKTVAMARGYNLWSDPAASFQASSPQLIAVIHSRKDRVTGVKHAEYLLENKPDNKLRFVTILDKGKHVTTALNNPDAFRKSAVAIALRTTKD